MAEEIIDHYIDRASIADDTNFLTGQLKTVLDLFDKVNATKITLNGAKGMSEVVDAAKKAKTAVDDLAAAKDKLNKTDAVGTKTSLAEAKVKKELALASKAEAQARKENAAAALLEAKAVQSTAKARKENADAQLKGQQLAAQEEKRRAAEQKMLDELSNDYLQLSRAYTEAAKKAKNYSLTLGENHPVTVEAVKDAKAMHDILLRVDQSVGQSQRNVGNYKEAFNGLSLSVSQIARELPSLAVSAQTFTLAISNNIPMLFDEVKKARLEIEALKAQGQAAPSLFQRLASATISWNVGLSVGVALLTTYSGKIFTWAKGLFDSSIALMKAAKAQDEFNATRKQGIENEKQYQSLLNNDAQDIFVRKQKEQLDLARARGASEKEILQLERDQLSTRLERSKLNFIPDQEFLGRKIGGSEEQLRNLKADLDKAKAAYQDFLKTGKAFGKEYKKGTEEFSNADQVLKNSFQFQGFLYDEQAAKVAEYYNAKSALEQKDAEIAKYNADQRAGFFADELQYRADILKNISQLEDAERITRLNARKQALKNEKAIIEGQYLDELFAAKNNQIKIFEATREYNFKRKKLAEEYERDVLAIRQTYLKRQREILEQENQMFRDDDEERLRREEEREQKAFETRKNYLEENGDYLLLALEKERNAKIAATSGDKERQRIEEEYNRKRKQVELDTNVAIIQSSLAVAEAKLKTAQQTPGVDENQLTTLKTAIASLKKQLEALRGVKIDLDIDNATSKLDKLKSSISEIGNIISSGFSVVGDAIQNGIDREKNAIQEQIDLIEKRKQADIDAVNALVLSEQEKAAKIAIINARAATDREVLERRQRQLDLQRARFDKARNIVEIVTKTAVAVIDGLIKGGPPLAAIYGAIGAAQLAVAIAQPLPKFKDGRKDGPATWGHVGDGGKHEVIYSPDLKTALLTPDTDTLAYIPAGYGVAPSVEDFQAMAMKMSMKPIMPIPAATLDTNDAILKAYNKQSDRIVRAIKEKPVTHITGSHAGVMAVLEYGNVWTEYVDKSVNF